MFFDADWEHGQLHYELSLRAPSYDDGKTLFRFVITNITWNPYGEVSTIQCIYAIDRNEIEQDVLFFLNHPMKGTHEVDFPSVDDATVWGFGPDCKVKRKYECMKTRLVALRTVKVTEGGFWMEATFECNGSRELEV